MKKEIVVYSSNGNKIFINESDVSQLAQAKGAMLPGSSPFLIILEWNLMTSTLSI